MKPPEITTRHVGMAIAVLLALTAFLYLGVRPLVTGGPGHADRAERIDRIRADNQQLKQEVALLKARYRRLRHRLDAYAPHDLRYHEMADRDVGVDPTVPQDIPAGLSGEGRNVHHAYHRLLWEKQRWDRLLQAQYKSILATTVEPVFMEYPALKNEENVKYFNDLTVSLKLHKKLIRDVRIFHSEIQFQNRHNRGSSPYLAYDYKLKLDPFARESSIADAMQQALSALSTGVYQQEAVEVLDRLGDEFTRPVRQEYERLLSTDGESAQPDYNYNIFLTFAKKIMDYADTLASQSSIPLAPKTLGELDFLHRRLEQSFHDLYEIGQQETIDAALLDMEELERRIQ